MQVNISYHIWYKACRPIKRKYKLSTNCLLVLNGSYVLYKTTNTPFTFNKIRTFVSYYNFHQITSYINKLIRLGYLVYSDEYNSYVRYSISLVGLQVIKELNDSYDKELVLFCSKYNIEL
jgi:hypothetical protein